MDCAGHVRCPCSGVEAAGRSGGKQEFFGETGGQRVPVQPAFGIQTSVSKYMLEFLGSFILRRLVYISIKTQM